jgi:hypothetical protein
VKAEEGPDSGWTYEDYLQLRSMNSVGSTCSVASNTGLVRHPRYHTSQLSRIGACVCVHVCMFACVCL